MGLLVSLRWSRLPARGGQGRRVVRRAGGRRRGPSTSNGVQVGAAAARSRHATRSGLGEPSRHRLPQKQVRFGGWNIVRRCASYYYDGRQQLQRSPRRLSSATRRRSGWRGTAGPARDDTAWAKGIEKPEEAGGALTTGSIRWTTSSVCPPPQGRPRPVSARRGAQALHRSRRPDHRDGPGTEPEVRQPLSLSFRRARRMWGSCSTCNILTPPPEDASATSTCAASGNGASAAASPQTRQRQRSRFAGADKITSTRTLTARQVRQAQNFVDGLSIATSCARGAAASTSSTRHTCSSTPTGTTTTFPDWRPRGAAGRLRAGGTHSWTNSLRWGRTAGSTPPRAAR